MPFTFSHPLFAIPLKKLVPRLSVTGLALGSMSPDMEYFIAMEPYRSIGHYWQGFLLLGVPVSIAAAAAFYRILLPLLPRLLPAAGSLDRYAADRAESAINRSPSGVSGWLWFFMSLYIGYLTHLFMDGMTHTYGWLVLRYPELLYQQTAGIKLYSWLQYLFSLLGMLAFALWLMFDYGKWLRARRSQSSQPAMPLEFRRQRPLSKLLAWMVSAAAGFLLFAPKILFAERPDDIGLWLVSACSAVLFGLFAAGLLTGGRGGLLAGRLAGLMLVFLLAAAFKTFSILSETMPDVYSANPLFIWIAYIWVLSLLVWLLSSSTPRYTASAAVIPRTADARSKL
ncbi:DUF4184 family protein [Paenibacillus pasadenensis]|uniref:DUF4184 family protein n=1 Tax=Paenibacillus pasadenensis TaxID=217090 RepID=UPI00203C9141|nr:DUF4184 family protein [Paenibacillus pasadenensis]MCM3745923.1 DUF4184 family protein [Paenibacillus pasadenensis]